MHIISMIAKIFFLLLIHVHVKCQRPSPCPDVFEYEERDLASGRWRGVITLISDEELAGITVSIGLDNPGESMGVCIIFY